VARYAHVTHNPKRLRENWEWARFLEGADKMDNVGLPSITNYPRGF
jgi:hypothetical protein